MAKGLVSASHEDQSSARLSYHWCRWLAVNRRDLQREMYERRDRSLPQRIALAAFAGAWLALVWWLLLGPGIATTAGWFGVGWRPGDPVRRAVLAAALSIYYVRILFTEFVFLKRGVSWSEVFAIVPWILCIDLLLAIAGGTNPHAIGAPGGCGLVLFVVGSWINSYGEYTRHVWKQKPENHGRLYTEGLFRYSRHPNYLGDLLGFSGMCVLAGAWITAVIPALMAGGFVFVNIPLLDAHLHGKYGSAFELYARRTRKLIPFVY